MQFNEVYCTDTLAPPDHANDSECLAQCATTGALYLCKKERHPYLAASEWICSSIARQCGIAIPDFAAVKIEGKPRRFFGSKWVDGAVGWAVALPQVKNSSVFSQALALDYTVSNPDRHLENYLYYPKDGAYVAEVIDFSRAFLVAGWPLPDLPMPDETETVESIASWKAHHPFAIGDANKVVDAWISLDPGYMGTLVANMPAEWLDDKMKQRLVEWWESTERLKRIHEVMYQLNYVK